MIEDRVRCEGGVQKSSRATDIKLSQMKVGVYLTALSKLKMLAVEI
jgi:hypothetical protein